MKIRGFDYTEEVVASLESTLSRDRLTKYLELAHNNTRRAVKIYVHNTIISESLYGPIQGLEVCLRNSLNNRLAEHYGENWYEVVGLEYRQRQQLDRIILELEKNEKALSPGDVIAGLSFGFWTGLFGPKYEVKLWRPCLRRAFPNTNRLIRKDVQKPLNNIRVLRNRIAHHEPVIHLDLNERYSDLIKIIEWMCWDTARWVDHHSRFKQAMETKMVKRIAQGITNQFSN